MGKHEVRGKLHIIHNIEVTCAKKSPGYGPFFLKKKNTLMYNQNTFLDRRQHTKYITRFLFLAMNYQITLLFLGFYEKY